MVEQDRPGLEVISQRDGEDNWYWIDWETLMSCADQDVVDQYTFYWACPACNHYNPAQDPYKRQAEHCGYCYHTQYGFDYLEFEGK